MRLLKILPVLMLSTLTQCSNAQIQLESVFPNLGFDRPVDFQHANDGSGRIFIVEQHGVIYSIETSGATKSLFLVLPRII